MNLRFLTFLRSPLQAVQRLIQVAMVKNQQYSYRAGDERVRQIKHRSEEYHLPRRVVNQWEVKHIHHLAVEPTCIPPNLAVEHAVNDVPQRTRYHARKANQIPRPQHLSCCLLNN